MTPDLWLLSIAGLGLLIGLWFAPRKSALSKLLSVLFILGLFARTVWGSDEYVQNVSVDGDGNVMVASEVLSREWAFRPFYALKVDLFSKSGRRIRTHSIKLPGGDYHGVSALRADTEGHVFMGLTPDRGGQPLLAKTSSDGRVLWMANTASPVCDIKINGFRVETIETSSNETRLTCEWFDSRDGRPIAEWSQAFPLWSYGSPRQVYLDANGSFSANAGDLDHPVLVKFTPAGQMVWKTPVRGLTPMALHTDARGNHYLAGRVVKSASIAKFSPDGDRLWSRTIFPFKSGTQTSITEVASAGESIFVLGDRLRLIRPSPQLSFEHRAFIAKLSPSGTVQWSRILKGNAAGYAPHGTGLALDDSGNAYVAEGRSGRKFALLQLSSAGRLKWKALAPDGSLLPVIIAVLALVIEMVKARREKRAAREPAIQP